MRFWRPDVKSDVDDELRFHLEMRERDFIANGVSSEEARTQAVVRFGNLTEVRESCYQIGQQRERRTRATDFISGVRNDVVFALRQLARNRGFTIAAVLTLALGIGANGLVLGLVNAVLLRPLPGVAEPDRLIAVTGTAISYPSFEDFRNGNPALTGVAAYSERSTAVSNGQHTEIAPVAAVTGSYFRVLGVKAARGRLLTDRDDKPGAPPTAVLSAKFASRFFPGEADVVGRSLNLNGMPVTVVGIAQEDFQGLRVDSPEPVWISAHTWMTLAPSSYAGRSLQGRGWRWLDMFGRLKPGATAEQAKATFNVSASRQEAAYPSDERGLAKAIATSPISTVGSSALSVDHDTVVRAAAIVTAVVAIVLLVACANVSNLLLARARARKREIGIRTAIGASRGRVVRQLLTETVVLALIAAVVGLAVTQLGLRIMSHLSLADGISIASLGVHVDGTVAGATVLVALVAGLIFGAIPALKTTQGGVTDALKNGTPGAGHMRSGAQRALLIAQVALSLTLLIGAGLFTRSLQRALSTDPGFDGSHVAVASIYVGLIRSDSARASQIYGAVTTQLNAVPGVRAAAVASALPLADGSDSYRFTLDDFTPPDGTRLQVEVSDVSPKYFNAFSIPILRGRVFNDRDVATAPHVAVINETMAHRYWREANPLGRRINFGGDTVTVIGVVRDVRYHELHEAPIPFVYRVLNQQIAESGLSPVNIVVRTIGNPAAAIEMIRRVMHDVAPEVPVYREATFDERSGHTIFAQRLGASVLGLFGVLALVITAIGIYGVVGYGVAQRTREIGIRIALGARTRSILRIVLIDNITTIVMGLAIGLVLSIALTRTVNSFLFGISATDALTFFTASILLLGVGTAATLIPALRAARVDPVIALRNE
ncbi:MAG: ABC transporter permease [Gemmatimonadaceae bacterium]